MSGNTIRREDLTGDAKFDRDWLLLRVRDLERALTKAANGLRAAGREDEALAAEGVALSGMPPQEAVLRRQFRAGGPGA
jgi:hypothetical protein